jgi:hypothetical protein
MGGGDLRQTLELFASFARDVTLIREGGEGRFLLNPDLEEELRAAAELGSLRRLRSCLASVDAALTGLEKNMNLSLLATAFYSSLGEAPHV